MCRDVRMPSGIDCFTPRLQQSRTPYLNTHVHLHIPSRLAVITPSLRAPFLAHCELDRTSHIQEGSFSCALGRYAAFFLVQSSGSIFVAHLLVLFPSRAQRHRGLLGTTCSRAPQVGAPDVVRPRILRQVQQLGAFRQARRVVITTYLCRLLLAGMAGKAVGSSVVTALSVVHRLVYVSRGASGLTTFVWILWSRPLDCEEQPF